MEHMGYADVGVTISTCTPSSTEMTLIQLTTHAGARPRPLTTKRSPQMNRATLLTTVAALATTTALSAATLTVVPVAPPNAGGAGWTLYKIIDATASPGEFITTNINYQGYAENLQILTASTDFRCYTTNFASTNRTCSPDRYSMVLPQTSNGLCSTVEEAANGVTRWVGLTFYSPAFLSWAYRCGAPGNRGYFVSGNVTVTATPTSCTANTGAITLRGRVGEQLTETTDLQIHCDQLANLRLSITNDGVVDVGGGGEVRLTFRTNGTAVLNTNGADPLISIDGELTKSPTTAGTYRGSTVLRLDIL